MQERQFVYNIKEIEYKQVQREKKELCRISVTFIIGRSLIEVLFFPDLK